MIRMIRPTLLLSLAASIACTTSSSGPLGGAPSQAPATAASGGHTFTPRRHPARHRPTPPRPDLASLPELVDNTRACFGPPLVEEEVAIARPPRARTGAGKTRRKSASKSGGRTSRKKTSKGFVPYDNAPASGAGRGAVGSSAASPPAPRPEPEPAKTASSTPRPKPEAKPSPKRDEAKDPFANKRPADIASSADDEAPMGDDDAMAIAQPQPGEQFDDWGAAIYLSNDDTMSLSSAQRVIYAIDNFRPLPPEHIRPHELLNYFSFATTPVAETDDFSVYAEIQLDPNEAGIYNLGLAIKGRPMSVDDRRNANISFVIDRSGSMSSEGRMEYLRRGLLEMTDELKTGDMVHLVAFDDSVCTPIKNFVVGRDDPRVLERAISLMEPEGSTNLHAGLTEGYAIADAAYQPTYTNRVVMITDAQTNTGVVDEELIATVGKFYDSRRIRLSGVGVGSDFNDYLLDRLTERGRGAYVFLGSEAEVDAVFGPRFVSLIETTALDVHFQLHLPPSLRMNVFYGEEASTVKEEVQPIHYFANTSQMFLSDLMAKDGKLREQDGIMLTIEYEDPETGDAMVEETAFDLSEIVGESENLAKARLVMRFVDGLSEIAAMGSYGGRSPGSWHDDAAFAACEDGHDELDQMSRGLTKDPEVRRVLGLWEKYCSRYEAPRRPVRREPASDTWPSASGN